MKYLNVKPTYLHRAKTDSISCVYFLLGKLLILLIFQIQFIYVIKIIEYSLRDLSQVEEMEIWNCE